MSILGKNALYPAKKYTFSTFSLPRIPALFTAFAFLGVFYFSGSVLLASLLLVAFFLIPSSGFKFLTATRLCGSIFP